MSDDQPTLSPGRRQAAVMFILVTVVIDVLGFGIVIPVLPKLVQQFMGDDPVKGAANQRRSTPMRRR